MPAKRLTIQTTFLPAAHCYEQQVQKMARASVLLLRGQERRHLAQVSHIDPTVVEEKQEISSQKEKKQT